MKELQENEGINVNGWTVRRALKRAGLYSSVKQKKPKLSSKHIQDRLNFAKRHQNWIVSDWKVILSNECKINCFNSNGQSWCWVCDGQASSHVQEIVKFGGGLIMIWGCMTFYGCGLFMKIDSKVDQALYNEILEVDLSFTICFYNMDPRHFIFQQDNAPIHNAKSMKQWFKQQTFGLLQWLAQSLDLNPIEHMWA